MADNIYSLGLKIPVGIWRPDYYAPVGLPESCTDCEPTEAAAAPSTGPLAPRFAAGLWVALVLLGVGAATFPRYALHVRNSAVSLASTPQPGNAPADAAMNAVPRYPTPAAPAVPASPPATAAPRKTVAAVAPVTVKPAAPLRRRIAARDDQADAAESIDKAIAAAKAALYRRQKDGIWEQTAFDPNGGPAAVNGGQFGGTTALAVYALLVAGEDPTKEPLLSAVKWLKTADIKGTYALGFRSQVWPLLDPKANDLKTLVRRDAQLLVALVKTQGPAMGFFDYLTTGPGGRYDHSVSQYGVFGLAACARSGQVEIPPRFWSVVEEAWIRDQGPATGGWHYDEGRGTEPKASMTAAGVITLLTTQEFLHPTDGVGCTGNPKIPHLDAGLKWLGDHFNLVLDDYTWYGVGRVGVDGGYKYFGAANWFKAGSEKLVRTQTKLGDWGTVPNTCFALLFLARGREPVAINKLEYTAAAKGPANWNQRPRDVANFSRWLGKQSSRFYNWQTVDLTAASDDVHDAPILYVAGNRALNLTKGEEGKLREYLDDGGLVVFNADCGVGARPFVDSIMTSKAGPSLPKRLGYDYEWRKLPEDHPIYTAQSFRRAAWKEAKTLDVYALGNGSRELMILFASNDPARYWQTQTVGGHEWAHELMGNLFSYATDKTPLPSKGGQRVVRPRPEIKADKSINVARLQYAQNWDPEPGGWRRLAAILHNDYRLDLNLKTVKLGDGTLAASGCPLAHLTGNTKYHLSNAEKNDLKAYVAGGGTLVVDACGGSAEFSDAMLADLGDVLGKDAEQLKQPISPDHPLFTAPGGLAEEIAYRAFAHKALGNTSLHTPRLRVALRNQKPVCYFSPEDLSTGLLGKDVDGIYGYTPAVATAVMRTILLSVEATP